MKPTSWIEKKTSQYASTRNACKLCSPLGASLAFKGVKSCIPIIHGSQGCATYIRRYLISHYREPVDIASSSFSEHSAVFGGKENLKIAINNIVEQYNPEVIGVATTCLSETIGEDVNMILTEYRAENKGRDLPYFVDVSTPSYQGTHAEGFHETVKALVCGLAKKGENKDLINIFPGFVSPEDLRQLKQILEDFELNYNMIPDYSETLDNPNWEEYRKIPIGGTPVASIEDSANTFASVELGYVFGKENLSSIKKKETKKQTAGEYLESEFSVVNHQNGLPIGIKETDRFFSILEKLSGKETPEKYMKERGRLVDAYVDGHKILFGKKAIVYGEEDLLIGLMNFLAETGIEVVLAITGANSGKLEQILEETVKNSTSKVMLGTDMDFEDMADLSSDIEADIVIGNSKGYYIAKKLGVPMIRVGFPVHDRFGSQRIKHLGYTGTQELYDKIANALLQQKQESNDICYKYL